MIKIKELNVGKYYWHRDSSHKGFHPAYIYKKNTRKNKYFHLNFTTSKGKGRRKLLKNIENDIILIIYTKTKGIYLFAQQKDKCREKVCKKDEAGICRLGLSRPRVGRSVL